MKAHRTFSLNRLSDGKVKAYFLKKIAGDYYWTDTIRTSVDIHSLPDKISVLDFSEAIEGEIAREVIVFTVPEQIVIRYL